MTSKTLQGRLYDTNVLLWFLSGDERLSNEVRMHIEDPDSKNYISIVSAWEVAIKISLQKLELEGGASLFWHMFVDSGFIGLPITIESVDIVQTLPYYHKDPFDRLLISTAIANDLEFITADDKIRQYAVQSSLKDNLPSVS